MATSAFVVDVSRDWAAASEVQQRFMHSGPAIGTLCYNARCRQVRELGGDFYDFMPMAGDRLALAVGDASGKGLAAALMISNVQSSLRTAASFIGDNTAAVIEAVNRQVYASSLPNRYATLFYGVFDERNRILRYVNAGHNPPIVVKKDGSTVRLESGGQPIGMFSNSAYREGVVQLDEDDLLIAYTDGVTEVTNQAGAEWGTDGLLSAIQTPIRRPPGLEASNTDGLPSAVQTSSGQCAAEVIDTVFALMDRFSRGSQADDATTLVLHVH